MNGLVGINKFEFEIVDEGQYQTTLDDLEWPAPFDTLLLFVSTGVDVVGTPLVGPGMFTFDADPGIFMANIFGLAGGDFKLGYFNVEVAATHVPVTLLILLQNLAVHSFCFPTLHFQYFRRVEIFFGKASVFFHQFH